MKAYKLGYIFSFAILLFLYIGTSWGDQAGLIDIQVDERVAAAFPNNRLGSDASVLRFIWKVQNEKLETNLELDPIYTQKNIQPGAFKQISRYNSDPNKKIMIHVQLLAAQKAPAGKDSEGEPIVQGQAIYFDLKVAHNDKACADLEILPAKAKFGYATSGNDIEKIIKGHARVLQVRINKDSAEVPIIPIPSMSEETKKAPDKDSSCNIS